MLPESNLHICFSRILLLSRNTSYVWNEYKSNSDLPYKNNLSGFTILDDAFIRHRHSTEITKIGFSVVKVISSL